MAVCLSSASAQEEAPRDARQRLVRFIDGRAEHVEILNATKEHLLLRFRDVRQPVPVRWWEIEPSDARALQAELLGAPSMQVEKPAAGLHTLPGVRVVARDGKSYSGSLIPGSGDEEIWIKSRDRRYVVLKKDIREMHEVALDVSEVYTDEELYDLLVRRLQPSSPEEWEKFGSELVRVRLGDRAVLAFRIAEMLRRPELPEGRLYRSLLQLRDALESISMKKAIHQIQEHYLVGEYDASLERIDRLEQELLEAGRGREVEEVRRLRGELHLLRDLSRSERIVVEWNRLVDALVRAKAFDRSLPFSAAREYLEKELGTEVEKRVSERFNLGPGDASARLVWDRRPEGVNKHSYGEASWIAERMERGDVEAWWSRADDRRRYEALMGMAVEKLYDVRQVVHKSCPECGGSGVVEPPRFPDRPAGQCPSCLGLQKHRVLIYR